MCSAKGLIVNVNNGSENPMATDMSTPRSNPMPRLVREIVMFLMNYDVSFYKVIVKHTREQHVNVPNWIMLGLKTSNTVKKKG
jgi:hypothetical protein